MTPRRTPPIEDLPPVTRGDDLQEVLRPEIEALERHPLYSAVRGPLELRRFMEHHAICVLDFMSLLKRLQRDLTCTRSPWTPAPDARAARLINEIVLDEESDSAFGDEPRSHYEWYVSAMDEVGVDSAPIRRLERDLREGHEPSVALARCGLPAAARAFGLTTFRLSAGPIHVVAAAFLFGREDVIPRMFTPLVRGLRDRGLRCDLLVRYLERHIEVDGGSHAQLATQLFERTLGNDPERRREGLAAARESLAMRRGLWDAVVGACQRTHFQVAAL